MSAAPEFDMERWMENPFIEIRVAEFDDDFKAEIERELRND